MDRITIVIHRKPEGWLVASIDQPAPTPEEAPIPRDRRAALADAIEDFINAR